jgi:hypothetical protein
MLVVTLGSKVLSRLPHRNHCVKFIDTHSTQYILSSSGAPSDGLPPRPGLAGVRGVVDPGHSGPVSWFGAGEWEHQNEVIEID